MKQPRAMGILDLVFNHDGGFFVFVRGITSAFLSKIGEGTPFKN